MRNVLFISALLAVLLAGCGNPKRAQIPASFPSGQRVIKVSFRGQHGSFQLRINQKPVEKMRNGDFTNVMTRLHLNYGDIVVWEVQRDESGRELSPPPETIWTWWLKHLEDARTSFYPISCNAAPDFFATPIYHWKGPPEKPRPLRDAIFYADGVSLGSGSPGFRAILDTIDTQKSRPVIILAPRIKNEGAASPWIADDQLLDWANDAGMKVRFEKIFFGRYVGFTDYARLNDNE